MGKSSTTTATRLAKEGDLMEGAVVATPLAGPERTRAGS